MQNKKLILFYITTLLLYIISGCTYQKHGNINIYENNTSLETSKANNSDNLSQKMFLLGEKMKELSEKDDKNEPIIYVNDYPITKEDVEGKKILCDIFKSKSLKDEINDLIKNKVIEIDANRLGIKPSQDKLNEYLAQAKEYLNNSTDDSIKSYIKGRGISYDEYIELLQKTEYISLQRAAWTESKENPEVCIDDLMKNAKIEIFDPEIKKILSE